MIKSSKHIMQPNSNSSVGNGTNTPVSGCTGIISDSLYYSALEFALMVIKIDKTKFDKYEIVHQAIAENHEVFISDYKRAIRRVFYDKKMEVRHIPISDLGYNMNTTCSDFECKRCKTILPDSERTRKYLKSGFIQVYSWCKKCNSEKAKEYSIRVSGRQDLKDRKRKRNKKYYDNNRELLLLKKRIRHNKRDEVKEERRLYSKKYYKENKAIILKKAKQKYATDPEVRKMAKVYRDRWRKKVAARSGVVV